MSDSWPQKWIQTELGNVAVAVTGCTYEQFDFPQDDLSPFNTIHDITDDCVTLRDHKYIRISEREKIKFRFKKGDIVFNYRTSLNQLGKTAVFDLDDTVIHTSKYIRIRPGKEYDSRFLELIFRLYKSEGRFKEMALKNSRLPSISLSQLNSIRVPVPPLEKQRQIVQTLNAGFDKLNSLKRQAGYIETALDDYRRRIADLVFSGKLIGIEGFRHHHLKDHLECVNSGTSAKPGQDILMVRSHVDHTCVGQSKLAEDDLPGCVYPATFLRLRPGHMLNPVFLNMVLSSSPVRSELMARANLANKGYRIGAEDVQALCIPVPSWTEQSRLIDQAAMLTHQVDSFASEYHGLKTALDNLPEIMLASGLRGESTVVWEEGSFQNLLGRIHSKFDALPSNRD